MSWDHQFLWIPQDLLALKLVSSSDTFAHCLSACIFPLFSFLFSGNYFFIHTHLDVPIETVQTQKGVLGHKGSTCTIGFSSQAQHRQLFPTSHCEHNWSQLAAQVPKSVSKSGSSRTLLTHKAQHATTPAMHFLYFSSRNHYIVCWQYNDASWGELISPAPQTQRFSSITLLYRQIISYTLHNAFSCL